MAHIRKLSTGKFRVEIKKNYTFIASKTFTSIQLAQEWSDDMDIQINYILSLKPKKLKKITPDKVEELGGMELFKKLGIELDFITFKMLCDEYMSQWNLKDQVNQMIRVDYWLSILGKDTPIKGIKTKQIDNALDDLTDGIYSAKGEKLKTPKSRSTNTTLRYRSVLSSLFLFAMSKKRRYIKRERLQNT